MMMMKNRAIRRFVLALGIASMVATVHGAWFAAPGADATSSAAVARVRFSVWDSAQREWISKYLTDGEVIQGAEGDIIELKPEVAGTSVSSIPSYLVAISLTTPPQSACERLDVSCTIPTPNPADVALAAGGTPFYGRLALSQVVYAVGSPNAGQPALEVGTPDVDDLSATDQGGSVGVNPVTLNVDADAISFTWDVSRWAKGDVFVGLNYAAYKVLDRHGTFKRYLASSDYGRLDKYGDPVGEATTGCAANWRTGEIFMTNFDDVDPAIDVVTRQPGSGPDYPFPYADQTRRLSTAIFRSQDPNDATWVYPIDTSPESIVFDGVENLYVGHSGPYFDTDTYSILDPSLKKVFDSVTSYSFVDELGTEVLARPMGSSGPGEPIYYSAVSSRLDTTATGDPQFNLPALFTWGTGGGESATLTLPKAIWEDAAANLALESVTAPGIPLVARPILGKRLHKYNYTGAPAAPYSGAARELHWPFTNLQGTDWIDLATDQRTMFYTSENSYIHRYDTVTGRQLADFGTGQRRQLGGPMRTFHALRILPPGDGTGGVIVAAGTEILRLNGDGQIIQTYQVVGDPDVALYAEYSDGGLVQGWYSLEVDPSGRTFWASGHDTGYLYQFDLATGAQLRRIKAVDYRPLNDPIIPFGRRVEGICIMWEYTAAQEVCGDGIDNDGDGFIDESCTPIESCSLASPGDDDGDGLADHNDPDCGEERPPLALADLYVTNQDTAIAIPSDGVLSNDVDPDNLDGDPLNDDQLTVGTVGTDVGTLSVSNVGAGISTEYGGTVALAGNGSFMYTPASGFHGVDTFVYQAFDGAGLSNEVTVTIRVRPVVADDSYTMLQKATLSVNGLDVSPAGILVNDSVQPMLVAAAGAGPGVTPFSFSTTLTTSQGGLVVIIENGNFAYQPPVTFVGVDSFVYRGKDLASDSSNLATVTITVEDVNELSATNDAVSTAHGTPVTVDVRANDVDPEGHTFRVTMVNGQAIATGQSVSVVNGTVTLNAAGSLVATPATGFYGLLTFTYTIEDSPALPMLPVTSTARVDVTVGAPSISGTEDSYTTPQNTLLIVPQSGVLVNDTGVGLLTVYSAGVSPALSLLNPWATFLTAEGGQITIRQDGGFTFAPRLNFVGIDRFNYTLINLEGTPSPVVAVYLTVTPTSSAAVVTAPNPSAYGTVVPVTATIRCGALLMPSVGAATFRQDATILASDVPVVNGIATTTLPASLVVGNHPVTVEYSGVVDVCPTAAASTTHTVTPAPLAAVITASDKPYDGTAAATVTSCAITGEVGSDNFTCTATTGTFAQATVGPWTVTPADFATAGVTSNYTAPATPTTTATITARPLAAVITASDKPYDGTAAATVTSCAITGEVGSDNFTCTATTGTFAQATAGPWTVTPTDFATAGVTSNYTAPATPTTTATITARPLAAVITASDKLYDGTAAALVTSCDVTGEIGADSFTCTATTGTFAQATAGPWTVTPTDFATAGVTGNYTAPATPTITATITARPLAAVITASDKLYDGTAAATVTSCAITGVIDSESVTCTATTGTFAQATAGPWTVTPTDFATAGVTGNYTAPATPTTTATITARPLAAVITASDKLYDGTAAATVTSCAITGEVGSDNFTCTATTGAFAQATVGPWTVTPADFATAGVTSNYTAPATPTTTATIMARPLAAVITASDKPYDGTAAATVTSCAITGEVGSDNFTCTATTGTFAQATAGSWTVTPADFATAGVTSNYTAPAMPTTAATISKLPLTVTANDRNKVYGATATFTGTEWTLTAGTLVSGDALTAATLTSTGAAPAAGAGSYPIVPSAAVGTGLSNYDLTYENGTLIVTKAVLTVTADNKSKVYGAENPPLTSTITGFVVGDTISAVTGMAALATTADATSAVGTYPITAAQGDLSAANYSFAFVNGTLTVTTATIPCTGTDGYTTYSQGGWGSKPNGDNPGQFLKTNFPAVYPGGSVTIGGNFTLKFTSALAIQNFLPQGGTPRALTASATNPTRSSAGNFAAQVLALRLAVDFSAAGVTKIGLGQLVMASGSLAGQTVNQVLAVANAVLGGQTSALPSGMSISTLNSIVESLNLNFHEGKGNEGLLTCGDGSTPSPDPDDDDEDDEADHSEGDGCDHDRGTNGHEDGDGCDHDRNRRTSGGSDDRDKQKSSSKSGDQKSGDKSESSSKSKGGGS